MFRHLFDLLRPTNHLDPDLTPLYLNWEQEYTPEVKNLQFTSG